MHCTDCGHDDYSVIVTSRYTVATKRELEFVHITKTGGSAIERAGGKYNISWGFCKYGGNPKARKKLRCPKNVSPIVPAPRVALKKGSPWHVPLQFFLENPLSGSATFAVVRDPFTRVISEYNCPWTGYKGAHSERATTLNRWNRLDQQKAPRKAR